MYKNIGKKIRGLAAFFGWAGMILCVLGGLIACVAMCAIGDEMILVGILCLLGGVVGALLCWVSTWFMYGIGELIVKTSEIADNTRPTAPTYGGPGYGVPGRAATAYGAPTFVPPAPQPRAPQAQAPQPQAQAPQAPQAPKAQNAQQGQCEFCKQTAYITAAKIPGLDREYKLCPQCIRQHNGTSV